MKRTAIARWKGSGKEGEGNLTTQSNVLDKTPYSWKSRFADGTGTNPEELIGAAHAGCFTMKLSFLIGDAGFTPEEIETTAGIDLEDGKISKSHLVVKAKVPGMDNEKFQECAEDARANCPVSQALSMEITMEATLLT